MFRAAIYWGFSEPPLLQKYHFQPLGCIPIEAPAPLLTFGQMSITLCSVSVVKVIQEFAMRSHFPLLRYNFMKRFIEENYNQIFLS